MRAQKVINFVVNELEQKLPSGLVYHKVDHTLDVIDAAIRIAKQEKVDDIEMDLIMVAAVLHDVGYITKYLQNENEAADYAGTLLPKFGYGKEEIALIQSCILSTKIPQHPTNHLAEIVCDADLDYLGREDFFHISEKLRNEWINFGLISLDKKEWNSIQVKFLEEHNYFTKSSKEARAALKSKNLEAVKSELKA